MSSRSNPRDLPSILVRLVRRDPRWLIVLLVIVGIVLLVESFDRGGEPGPAPPASAEGYLVCSWNVENLFDDTDDPRNRETLDTWFATDPTALSRKLDLLADTLLRLNDGKGPDVLALTEVENLRAIDLLRQALNRRLETEWHYTGIVHKDNISGRRIEPAIITRLPIDERGIRPFPAGRRLVGVRLEAEGRPLDLIVGHWTSRVTDRDGSKRLAYAREMYDAYLDLERRTEGLADVIICGDFNDEPDDESVRLGLRGTGDASAVIASGGTPQPRLLNLMAGREPERFGTYRYRDRWLILDQIIVSPGMLDPEGWSASVDTIETVNGLALREGRGGPLRFGDPDNPNPRGPSDHFAVCVRIIPPDLETDEGARRIARAPDRSD